jgi:2-oxoglutarate ferredoxin oxidoreductase subunit delta
MSAAKRKKLDAYITWSPDYCKHCYTCIDACAVDNLKFDKDEMVSMNKCIQCRLCEKYCPDFAIEAEPKKKKSKKAGKKKEK